MKRLLLLAVVVGFCVGLVTYAQNPAPLTVTAQKIAEYKTEIEFDLVQPITGVAMLQFELVLAKIVCNIDFKAPTAFLNKKSLGQGVLANDNKTFRFVAQVANLLPQGNKLVADSGSCKIGDHKLGLFRGLEIVIPLGTTTSQIGG